MNNRNHRANHDTVKRSPEAEENPTPAAVLRYAERHWQVFPTWPREGDKCGCGNPDCEHQGKHPIGRLVPKGFKQATDDVTTLERWWHKCPNAGIGVATGEVSGMIVLDIDKKNGKDGEAALVKLEEKLGPLPKTKTARTPSGSYHEYYCYVEGVRSTELAPGLEIKSDGGSVVAPPSHDLYQWIDGRKAAELPEAWVEYLRNPKDAKKKSAESKRKASIDELAAALAVIPNDADVGRDEWIRVGMALHHETNGSEQGFELFDEWSKEHPTYNEGDTQKAWDGFEPHGDITAGTIFLLADQASPGWRGNGGGHPKKQVAKQADILIAQAADADLFHTNDGVAYADVDINDHRETWPVRSTSFREWLLHGYYTRFGTTPTAEALRSAVETIGARARFDGPMRDVYVRVAGHHGKIYLDLADEEWRAVVISKTGWCVIEEPPVRFRRAPGMQPLPLPSKGGSVEELREFVNVESDDDFVLLLAYLLAALRGRGPYPGLALKGESGAAKSTASKVLHSLVDPCKAERSLPREPRDLFIATRKTHVLSFGNVSWLPNWLSDCLCSLSTGGGWATRALYTDEDEVLFDGMCPFILNGIEFATRPDLTERLIFLNLPIIPDDKRRTEREFWSAFEAKHPTILGALLDVVVHGLRELPNTPMQNYPRMADFAHWVTACEGALWEPDTFRKAYAGNRRAATNDMIDANPVATAISSLMEKEDTWAGTATELLAELETIVGEKETKRKQWPGSASALSARLRRLATPLRRAGINVDFDREGHVGTRTITIEPAKRGKRRLRRLRRLQRSKSTVSADDALAARTTPRTALYWHDPLEPPLNMALPATRTTQTTQTTIVPPLRVGSPHLPPTGGLVVVENAPSKSRPLRANRKATGVSHDRAPSGIRRKSGGWTKNG